MKVSYISDLHLDFWVKWVPNQTKWEQRTREFVLKLVGTDTSKKEVLALGGDYSHYNSQTMWMLDEFSKAYEQVLLTFGNHDHYLVSNNQVRKYTGMYKHIHRNQASLARVMELDGMILNQFSNVLPLWKGRTWVHEGVKFGGDTMWYPLNTIEQEVFYYGTSNDSRLIYGRNPKYDNMISLSDYRDMVEEEKIDVMISHVPLIHTNYHSEYKSISCYYTPVDMLPPYVIQGHTHEVSIYEKDETMVYMNCLGYPEEFMESPSILNFEVVK